MSEEDFKRMGFCFTQSLPRLFILLLQLTVYHANDVFFNSLRFPVQLLLLGSCAGNTLTRKILAGWRNCRSLLNQPKRFITIFVCIHVVGETNVTPKNGYFILPAYICRCKRRDPKPPPTFFHLIHHGLFCHSICVVPAQKSPSSHITSSPNSPFSFNHISRWMPAAGQQTNTNVFLLLTVISPPFSIDNLQAAC